MNRARFACIWPLCECVAEPCFVAVFASLIATPARAKGLFQGTFGTESIKLKKRSVVCLYQRSTGLLLIQASKGNRRRQTGVIITSTQTADPTVPGVVFPTVVDLAIASLINGAPPTPPVWQALPSEVVVTLTGYTRGKLSGTVTGTMQPTPVGGATGTIQVDATFTVKCRVQ